MLPEPFYLVEEGWPESGQASFIFGHASRDRAENEARMRRDFNGRQGRTVFVFEIVLQWKELIWRSDRDA